MTRKRKKEIRWFDYVHILLLIAMIVLIFLEKYIGLKAWGFSIGVISFTIWTFISFLLTKFKDKKKIFIFENILFLIIFIGYSILAIILLFQNLGLISAFTLTYSLIFIAGSFYIIAAIIGSKFLIKNKNNLKLKYFL